MQSSCYDIKNSNSCFALFYKKGRPLPMAITQETINKIASLAKLELTEEEAAKAQKTLAEIIEYANVLNDSSYSNIKTLQKTPSVLLPDIEREDITENSLSRQEILSVAALHDNDYYLVPKTVD
jgi:aspartyl-tRNA(Asn)/glutamyl-tRNA(Gln) amidotransferase subunit C